MPADRGPGRPWKPGPPIKPAPSAPTAKPIRIGYARCSAAQQELQGRLDALEPRCELIFSEKISTRVKVRPELEKALKLAYDIREAAPDPRGHPRRPRAQAPRPQRHRADDALQPTPKRRRQGEQCPLESDSQRSRRSDAAPPTSD
ncbi:recombinase family protein [Streptosporangium amethystogenes]|uniref:recombinase family protein n=1 Tax=Streptosporangium amethystogenes TaxID=2002 RepID=UPI00379EE31F